MSKEEKKCNVKEEGRTGEKIEMFVNENMRLLRSAMLNITNEQPTVKNIIKSYSKIIV